MIILKLFDKTLAVSWSHRAVIWFYLWPQWNHSSNYFQVLVICFLLGSYILIHRIYIYLDGSCFTEELHNISLEKGQVEANEPKQKLPTAIIIGIRKCGTGEMIYIHEQCLIVYHLTGKVQRFSCFLFSKVVDCIGVGGGGSAVTLAILYKGFAHDIICITLYIMFSEQVDIFYQRCTYWWYDEGSETENYLVCLYADLLMLPEKFGGPLWDVIIFTHTPKQFLLSAD